VRRLFQTAHDVPAGGHLRNQAAFQRHVDNAVSKTVDLPRSASVADVGDVLRSARDLDLKGVTGFRSGSRSQQVLGESPRTEGCAGECDHVAPREPRPGDGVTPPRSGLTGPVPGVRERSRQLMPRVHERPV
jgi:ribonucleoside-diphosphate reductase alpha chain